MLLQAKRLSTVKNVIFTIGIILFADFCCCRKWEVLFIVRWLVYKAQSYRNRMHGPIIITRGRTKNSMSMSCNPGDFNRVC